MNKKYIEIEKILKELKKFIEKYSIKNQKDYLKLIEEEINKIQNNEFTIAVIGTMKAGKSTFINSVVGDEILPHRNEAMTTIPTKITHKKGKHKPFLYINDFEYLNNISNMLKEKVKKNNINFEFENIKRDYESSQQIFNILKYINDLLRTAKQYNIEIDWDRYKNSKNLPTIEIEFFAIKRLKNLYNVNFSFIDTPGPNEYGMSQELKEISKAHTKNASSVILIIDFTKITGEDSHSMKTQINEVFELIDNKNIFILVNKFDETEKSSSELSDLDKLPEYIIKKFLENKKIRKSQIIPLSARNAFYSNWGLKNIKNIIGKEINENENLKFFVNNIIGKERIWKKINSDEEEIKEYCLDALEESNFDNMLKNIINKLYKDSEKSILDGALKKIAKIIEDLDKYFDEQIGNYEKTQEKLKEEIELIKEELNNINKNFKNINKILKNKIQELKKKENNLLKFNIKNVSEQLENEIGKYKDGNKIFKKFENKKNFLNFQNEVESLIENIFIANYKSFVNDLDKKVENLEKEINNLEEYKKLKSSLKNLKEIDMDIELKKRFETDVIFKGVEITKIKTDYYWTEGDGFFDPVLSWFGDIFETNWGKKKVYYDVFIFELDEKKLKKLFENYEKLLKEYIENVLNQMGEKFENTKEYINSEIKRYQDNKEKVLNDKKQKTDKEIKEIIESLKEEKEYLKKLRKRKDNIKKIDDE